MMLILKALLMLMKSNIMANAFAISTIDSINYVIRIMASDYLHKQANAVLIQDQPSDNIEFVKYCGASIFSYMLPTITTCAISTFISSDITCIANVYDLSISASIAGAQCYAIYNLANINKTHSNDDSYTHTSSIANTALPYIADAIALFAASQCMHFDASNSMATMQSVKQYFALASTVVMVDYMTKTSLDLVSQEIKETYIDNPLNYLYETVNEIRGEALSMFADYVN